MAGTFTHWMVVEEALDKYSSLKGKHKYFNIILRRNHFVNLGAVGPDYPYLTDLMAGMLKTHTWADRMHYENTGETFVTDKGKGGSHLADAKKAVNDFILNKNDLNNANSIKIQGIKGEIYSLIGAALIRSQLSYDLGILNDSCIVIKTA